MPPNATGIKIGFRLGIRIAASSTQFALRGARNLSDPLDDFDQETNSEERYLRWLPKCPMPDFSGETMNAGILP